MNLVSKDAAACAISEIDLLPANRSVAEYWLSLWQSDALPSRQSFNPSHIKAFLPVIMIFEVVPHERVSVRLAGTIYQQLLHVDLTGRDWIEMAPPSFRAERLRIFSELAAGAIGVGYRSIKMIEGHQQKSEEILLPFGPDNTSGKCQVLMHAQWDHEFLARIESIAQAIGDEIDFRTIPLR